jgi:phenylalanine-4-hydroxylase
MFYEAQLYSPVTENDDGSVTVQLAKDHPGACDPAYRERRNHIAAQAVAWTPGEPLPRIEYTEAEHEVWRIVSRELAPKHAKYACRDFREAAAALALPTDRIPQLDEVTAGLQPLTGWSYHAAAGLVPLREFLGALGDRIFHSTQYIRHGAMPLYTPEPDLIHEVIGHGNLLADPDFAQLNRLAGLAAQRVQTAEALQFLADVFWFTIEFGVLWEDGELRAYGAGILSSYGEIEEFRHMEIRPFDVHAMGTLPYDITAYQPILFAAPSMGALVDELGTFFAGFDDDTPARLHAAHGAARAPAPRA